ncbi:MAG: HAMP domain-containing sensor histidine kinase [Flavobacteriales bacterium]|nr:HAMP domain-containing sensor histidine kinase [Flavobacteriales bacterium]
MKQKSIRLVIWLATIALLAVIIMQFFWINKSIQTQNQTIDIQKKNIEIENQQFENRVNISLTNVRDKLLLLNDEAAGFYLDPVKQITKNYFVVSFYDTLSHELLENFLISEFQQRHIQESFEYGIYDCFSDSIIYDKYVGLSKNTKISDNISANQQKWDHDGHYFGVYFPDRIESAPSKASEISYSLAITSIIIILIVAIFTYAISIILRQKKLSVMRNDFINNMTHELKTPISTIHISSDVLLRTDIHKDPERIKRYAKIIKAENNRLEGQVEKVLQLAKLEKGEIQLNKSIINIHTVIKNIAETFEISIQDRKGKLHFELNAEHVEIEADPLHITNVIATILDNANKYSPEEPEISINTLSDKEKVIISIQDNGKGIKAEDLKHVFEKFYRVPTGNIHDVKGFGLGLFYVKSILKSHNGHITASSEPNIGSTFTITLPLIK